MAPKPSFLDAIQGKRSVQSAAPMETDMPAMPEPEMPEPAEGAACPSCGAKLKIVADDASMPAADMGGAGGESPLNKYR
jgi:hypothetical protein